jgi:GT2 family glycosyltransferase
MVSLIIITYNRKEFFSRCIKSMIETTKNIEKELIVWDNGSTDGTVDIIKEYAKKYSFVKPILYDKNIGVNGKAKSIELAKGDYIVCSDDDVIEFPENWLEKMIKAYKIEPKLGYLALDVIQNEHTTGAKYPESAYTNKEYPEGITLQYGAVGGWIFMVSREVYRDVGRFRTMKNRIFYPEDGDYVTRCDNKGYLCAILKEVKCFHATGPYYNERYKSLFNEKMEDNIKSDMDLHRMIRGLTTKLIKIKKKFFYKK